MKITILAIFAFALAAAAAPARIKAPAVEGLIGAYSMHVLIK
jgi:hypothetical protein